jgi:hypothetical protein
MDDKALVTYDAILKQNPKIAQFFREQEWDVMQKSNSQVLELLGDLWTKNLHDNLESLFDLHGTIKDGCWGQGQNRALIGIGAGPTFNKNKDQLAELCWLDAKAEAEMGDHPFVFVASNHQFKPCLELGIIPHFVVLCDGSDVVFDQLCVDIPDKAKGCVLLCPLRSSNRVLKEWTKQGRSIKFYMGENPEMIDIFTDKMGYHPRDRGYTLTHGGNVLNQMFLLGLRYLKSTVFMCVGNDLSYEYDTDLDKRRNTYYADGDYSTNLGTGRDEAKRCFPWMGYTLEESILCQGEYMVKFEPRMTTGQLMLYKMWVENQVAVQETWSKPIHYYNCTEGGILGVASRGGGALHWDEEKQRYMLNMADQVEKFNDRDNWFLVDEVLPKRWHTTTLEKAAAGFLFARTKLREREQEGRLIVSG